MVEHLGDVPGVRGHHRHADEGAAVEVEVSGLGDRDRVLALQLGDDRAHHGALLLDAPDVAEQQVELQGADEHVVSRAGDAGGAGRSTGHRHSRGFSRIS